MLRIVTGRAKTGKSTYCFTDFTDYIVQDGPRRPAYYVVPEQYTMVAEREILKQPGMEGRALLGDEVLSFRRLAYRVASALGGVSAERMNEQGRIMLLTEVAYRLRGDLTYYGTLCNSPWQIRRVLSLLEEFEKYRIDADRIAAQAREPDVPQTLAAKLTDLSQLYRTYLERLHTHCMTEADLYEIAVTRARKAGFFAGSAVWVDEFTGFTAVEQEFLRLMLEECDTLTVALCMDTEREPIFEGIRETFDRLTALAEAAHVPWQVTDLNQRPAFYHRAPALRALERAYTAFYPQPYVPQPGTQSRTPQTDAQPRTPPTAEADGPGSGLEIHESRTVYTEVFYAAASLRRLHASGMPYGRMAIAVRDTQTYGPLLEAELQRQGIPYFLDTRRGIESNPLTVSIRALLEILDNGFRYEDVAAFLKAHLYDTDLNRIDELDNYILCANLRGEKQFLACGQEDCVRMAQDILTVRDGFQASACLRDAIDVLLGFLRRCGFEEKIAAIARQLSDEGRADEADEYCRVWNMVLEIFDQLTLYLGDVEVHTVSDVCSQLTRMLSSAFTSYRAGYLPQTLEAVQIIGIDRSRVSGLRALFVLGASEGVLPASLSGNGVLSDPERDWLKQKGVELSDDSTVRIYKEQFMIYATLFSPSEFLCVSYPMQGTAGEAMLPSEAVVQRLRDLYPSLSVTAEEPPERAPEGAPARETFARETANGSAGTAPATAGLLPTETARCLFLHGDIPHFSISQIETYTSCPYRYFLTYGIGATERQRGVATYADIGSMLHWLIENGSRRLSGAAEDAPPDRQAADSAIAALCEQDAYAQRTEILRSTARGRLLAARLAHFASAALCAAMQYETGGYRPVAFEIPFGGRDSVLPPITVPVRAAGISAVCLVGRIDRLDAHADGGKLYVRVIDYKSSKKAIDRDSVLSGDRLQLLSYLKAVLDSPESRRTAARLAGAQAADGSEPMLVPGGALYFTVESDIISGGRPQPDGTGNEKKRDKKFQMEGLVLTEEEFTCLSESISDTVRKQVCAIAQGRVAPAPRRPCPKSEIKLPCLYCAYSAVCGAKYAARN